MLRKRRENLTIIEAYELFNREKIAQGVGDINSKNYFGELERMCRRNKIDLEADLTTLDQRLITDYTIYLREKNYALATINHDLRCLRVFLYWCMENNYIDPFKIKLVKGQEEKIKYCTREELEKLLKYPDKDDFVEYRNFIIISFILATGARSATILELKHEDIDLVRRTVTFRHLKNKRVATLPLSNTIYRLLKEFIEYYDTDSEYVFCSIGGEQMTRSSLSHALAQYCKERKVARKGPHAFRHTFAREWILNGGNAFSLQQMLTHSDLTMTRKYVRLFAEDIRDANFDNYVALDQLKKGSSRTKTVRKATR